MSILSQKYKDYQFIQGTSEQGKSDDLISRQAVLDLLEDTDNGWIINEVVQLPSVTPTERTGHWINFERPLCEGEWISGAKCDKCGYEIGWMFASEYNYCPNCGCRMVEPQESEDKE